VTYAAAVLKWTAAGFKVRSEEEVKAIFAQHCGQCEHFRPTGQTDVGYCGAGCGCVITPNPSIRNKIFIATEHCDLGKW